MNHASELTPVKSIHLPRTGEETTRAVATPAAFVSTATIPAAIGFFHLLSELSPNAKTFLTLHTGIGPYSGKVLFGYLAGLLVGALWGLFGRRIRVSPWVWLSLLLTGLMVGTALVFTPMVHWLVHLLR